MNELQSLHARGQAYIGKMAQSTVLTMITNSGGCTMEPAQKITGYTIQDVFMEPVIMVAIDGCEVFEYTLRNIH